MTEPTEKPRARTISRLFRRAALVSIIAVACASGAGAFAVIRQLPDDKVPPFPKLTQPVHVDFDARAIPTVHASTLTDALRVQGYLTARERLFQMELQRRAADGEISAMIGAAALPLDRIHRIYGFKQIAEAAVALLPHDEREQLEAYADGVNAFIESHPKKWGIEFAILGIAPRLWSPADSVKVLLLMHEQLSSTWKDELQVATLARLPIETRRFLMPRITKDDVLVSPDADPAPSFDAESLFLSPHAEIDPRAIDSSFAITDPAEIPANAGTRSREVGSNNWVIAGSRTKSGKAILANDPHLGLSEPGIWYALRLVFPDHMVEGVSIAGLPGIVIGQNDRVAWGFTNLGTDVQDLFVEDPTGERVETIDVKGAPAETLHVAIGKHGPQVRPRHSLAWTALDPKNLRIPIAGIMNATNWTAFNLALDSYDGPAQNVVYADIDGHIGWRATGLIPIRRDGDDGSVPRDGSDSKNDWRGFVAMSDMPRVFDPPSGFIVTANQRTIGTAFAHSVTSEWGDPFRAKRISEAIVKFGKLDRGDVEAIQLDVLSIFHREMMAMIAADVPGLDRFKTWDGAARGEDATFLIAYAYKLAVHDALAAKFGIAADADFDWPDGEATFLALLAADAPSWKRAGLGDRAAFMVDVKTRADAWLANEKAKTWGEFNALDVKHPFGRAGKIAGWIFDPPHFAQSGGSGAPRVAHPHFGQSMRFIVDWAAPSQTTLVLPLGESGHLASSHRTDQQAIWRDGDKTGSASRFEAPPSGAPLTFDPIR